MACAAVLLGGCAAVEKGGAYTRISGESLTDYSKKNDGFVGTMAGVGGTINTAVGSMMENMAKGSSGSETRRQGQERNRCTCRRPASRGPQGGRADEHRRHATATAGAGLPSRHRRWRDGQEAVDALKAFQKDQKLAVTGELNNETIAKLRSAKRAG